MFFSAKYHLLAGLEPVLHGSSAGMPVLLPETPEKASPVIGYV